MRLTGHINGHRDYILRADWWGEPSWLTRGSEDSHSGNGWTLDWRGFLTAPPFFPLCLTLLARIILLKKWLSRGITEARIWVCSGKYYLGRFIPSLASGDL